MASSLDRQNNQDHTLAAVYCSSLKRAIDSAEIIAGPQGLKPVEIPDLGERSFGIWEGLTFSEIGEKHPEAFAVWLANPLTYNPGGGENTLQVSERVTRAMELIGARHQGSSISVVAHGGVNRIILCHILGMTLENVFRIEQDYGAVNIIEFWDDYPVVKLMNGPSLADREGIYEKR
jgi:broad specificity phosphatase PhoE